MRYVRKGAVLLVIALLAWTVHHRFAFQKIEEHVASVSWLPEDAADISYFLRMDYRVFEFSISEEAFAHWARGKGMNVTPIDRESDITRYTARTTEPPPGGPIGETSRSDRAFEARSISTRARVRDGLEAISPDDQELRWRAIYDRKRGRAFGEMLSE